MGLFTENEILLMIGVVSVLLLIILVLTIFDIVDYVKAKKGSVEIDEDEEIELGEKIEEVIPKKIDEQKEDLLILEVDDKNNSFPLEEKTDSIIEPFIEEEETSIVLSPKDENNNAIGFNEIEPNKKGVILDEELNKVLNTIPNEENAVLKFEEEQERTAIISLDELMKKSDELYNSNEVTQYDDGNEPISINEVIERFKNEEVSVPEVMQDIVEEKPVYTHKETIPFISSVYGIEKNDNSLEFENTATYEKLSRASNNEFMNKLREVNENKN